MTTDLQIEQEIVTKGLVAPRVSLQQIEDAIIDEYYFTASDGALGNGYESYHPSLSVLTFCVLVLRNGFTVTGESACASLENYNETIGNKIAREKAKEKIWALEGYLLKSKLQH